MPERLSEGEITHLEKVCEYVQRNHAQPDFISRCACVFCAALPRALATIQALQEELARVIDTIRQVEEKLQQARKSELAWLETYQERVRDMDNMIVALQKDRDRLVAENARLEKECHLKRNVSG